MFGLTRITEPPYHMMPHRKGWRLNIPVLIVHGRRYSIIDDDYRTGWWFVAVSVAIEHYGSHGAGLRLNWGMMPSKSCRLDPEREEVYNRLNPTTGAWRA